MKNRLNSKTYAKVIFDAAFEKKMVFSVLEMLDILLKHLEQDEKFRDFIYDPLLSLDKKRQIFSEIYKDLNNDLIEILDYLLSMEIVDYVREIRKYYLEYYDDMHNQLVVTAIFAKEISDEQKLKLSNKLEKIKNRRVLLNVKIDPSIIAGGILKIGDELIDGSLKSQINEIRNKF